MAFGYVVLGIVVGVWAGALNDNMALGVLGGLAIGLLFARMMRLERRVTELELRRPPAPLAGTEPLTGQPAARAQEPPAQAPRTAAIYFCPESTSAASMALRVSLVNLQKLTL